MRKAFTFLGVDPDFTSEQFERLQALRRRKEGREAGALVRPALELDPVGDVEEAVHREVAVGQVRDRMGCPWRAAVLDERAAERVRALGTDVDGRLLPGKRGKALRDPVRHVGQQIPDVFGDIDGVVAVPAEIAYDVGFSSPSYFSECFRKQFGKSPSEFNGDK